MIILMVVTVNLLMFNHYIATFWHLEKDQQNVYYLFSSSAQSIATFIAFLIAGYALVYQAMDNLENRDDTLMEIHHKIKSDYYNKIKKLAVVTGLAIVLSLTMIWLNSFDNLMKKELLVITNLFILLAIVMGLWFVVNIIDPNKIRKAAIKLIEEKFKNADEFVDEGELIKIFIKLEKIVRETVSESQKVDPYVFKKSLNKDFLSFREMIRLLYRSEQISKDFYTDLAEINQYRNLVVHGHVSRVDQQMFSKTEKALKLLEGNILAESVLSGTLTKDNER